MKPSLFSNHKLTTILSISILIVAFQNCSESRLNLGSENIQSTPTEKSSCVGPSGESIEHGATADGYFVSSDVSCSETCVEKVMSCNDGKLMGATGEVMSNADIAGATANSCRSVCDNRTVIGHQADQLIAGKPYLVSVYGVTRNKGTGTTTLVGPRLEDCNGTPIATASNSNVNWHDGQAPQTHTFSITAPAGGCVRGFVDGVGNGEALNLTVSEQKEAGSSAIGAELNGLQSGQKYLVNVYGTLRNVGQGNAVVNAASVQTCQALNLASTDSTTINWPDGNTPHATSLAIVAPADGCVAGLVDAGDASDISAQRTSGDARTVAGNQVNQLTPGAQYLVTAYGYTTTITNENATEILDGVVIEKCDGSGPLASTQSVSINWHDGATPMSATLAITAPEDGCVQGSVDANAATTMTVFQVN